MAALFVFNRLELKIIFYFFIWQIIKINLEAMKKVLPTTKQLTILVLAILMGTGLTMAQSRYKHVPRIKVDVKHQQDNKISNKKKDKINFSPVATENNLDVASNENVNLTPVEGTEVASTSNETVVVATPKTKTTIAKSPKITKQKPKAKFDLFGDHFNMKSKLLKVKSVDKAQGTVGIILLISFYVLAILFTILCIVFLFDTVNPAAWTLFLVFLILAIVFALAGSVMLTLLKLGVV